MTHESPPHPHAPVRARACVRFRVESRGLRVREESPRGLLRHVRHTRPHLFFSRSWIVPNKTFSLSLSLSSSFFLVATRAPYTASPSKCVCETGIRVGTQFKSSDSACAHMHTLPLEFVSLRSRKHSSPCLDGILGVCTCIKCVYSCVDRPSRQKAPGPHNQRAGARAALQRPSSLSQLRPSRRCFLLLWV